jgi:hypothetical protein
VRNVYTISVKNLKGKSYQYVPAPDGRITLKLFQEKFCAWANMILFVFFLLNMMLAMLGGIPVPTAWRVLGLRMEERPPDMEVGCEYIE